MRRNSTTRFAVEAELKVVGNWLGWVFCSWVHLHLCPNRIQVSQGRVNRVSVLLLDIKVRTSRRVSLIAELPLITYSKLWLTISGKILSVDFCLKGNFVGCSRIL